MEHDSLNRERNRGRGAWEDLLFLNFVAECLGYDIVTVTTLTKDLVEGEIFYWSLDLQKLGSNLINTSR